MELLNGAALPALMPQRGMMRRTFRGGGLSLLATVAAILVGCSQPSQDELREEEYLPRFEAAMEARQFCDALEIAGQRVNYVDTSPLQEETARRLLAWVPRMEAAKAGCAREQWPAHEAELKAEIQKAQAQQALYQDLDRLSLTAVAGSWREDGKGFHCLVDVEARNGSSEAISAFTLSPDPQRDIHITAQVGPLDPVLAPGEIRTITACVNQLHIGRYLQGDNLPALPLYATSVELQDGRKARLGDWRGQDEDHRFNDQVVALQGRLVAENPFR